MSNDVIDHDVDDPEHDAAPTTTALDLRRTDVPVTLSDLAALKGQALEVVDARVTVVVTLRRASIRLTSPADWLLFKAPEEQGGQVVGYLQDAGADRVRDLWGIEIYNLSKPEKIVGSDPNVFHYVIMGSGRCKLTRQVLEDVEGGRSSTDDFCRGKTGAELELLVRKAARANLDGNITRELAGMKSVPAADLEEAWAGTKKSLAQCRRGRGFGTRDERVGGRTERGAPDVDPPICPHCHAKGIYRPAKGDRAAFYGCPNYEKHPTQKFIVDAGKWLQEAAQRTAAAGTSQPASPAANGKVTPLTADEVFGGKRTREPGEEG